MQAVLRLPCPGVAELREMAARCYTLAMRADRSAQRLVPSHSKLHPGGVRISEPHACVCPATTDERQDGIWVGLEAEP